ncbi:MAG: glycosyltransferase family 4 protein [Flavobacteriales bacterium]|jgi:glycosyltransferase involved in cell wall biosynthesis|nr:glycosyltransferase family 4 protein [Flavobacteriales bacterium]
MHILLLTDGITPFVTGGMQRHSANLAKYFTLQGVKVSLVHCVGDGEQLPSDEEVNFALFGNQDQQLYKIYSFNFPKKGKMIGHYIRNSYLYSKQIFEALDFSDVDFVYAKGFSGWYFLEQKSKNRLLPPIGVKFHGYEMFQLQKSFKQRLKSFLLKGPTIWNNEHADYIFSYGGKITELIIENITFPEKNILEFPSGLDNEWLRTTPISVEEEAPLRFVFIGRYETRKGVKELNSAIQTILLKKVEFEFHFIGPIPEEAKVKHPKITYHGEISDKSKMVKLIDTMDVLVCPSHSEGMPNVILEGMARGLAILATDVGAVEFIVDESNGRIIPPLNQQLLEESLVEFLMLSKVELKKKKKKSLSKIQNEYLWEKLAIAMLKKISELKKK